MAGPRGATARVESVNVGRSSGLLAAGQLVMTGIFKDPVAGRVRVRGMNLDGDEQADLAVHGGSDQAVYAYRVDDLEHWAGVQGHPIAPGSMGENLTISGLDPTEAVIGERWSLGSAVLEVTGPRVPCYKLGIRMGDPGFVKRFAKARRPGAYLRVVVPGELGAGDAIEAVDRPDHGITVGDVVDICYRDRDRAGRLLAVPQLAARWAAWARGVTTNTR